MYSLHLPPTCSTVQSPLLQCCKGTLTRLVPKGWVASRRVNSPRNFCQRPPGFAERVRWSHRVRSSKAPPPWFCRKGALGNKMIIIFKLTLEKRRRRRRKKKESIPLSYYYNLLILFIHFHSHVPLWANGNIVCKIL